jgi:hypothetical protein
MAVMDRAKRITEILDKNLSFLQETLILDEIFYAKLQQHEMPSNLIDLVRVSSFAIPHMFHVSSKNIIIKRKLCNSF